MGDIDISLEPLEKFRGHHLYPRARCEVLATKRRDGVNAARRHARAIADAMTDMTLEGLLK